MGQLGEAWTGGRWGRCHVKNSQRQVPLGIHMSMAGKQVELQGKVWPGDINLGPISL